MKKLGFLLLFSVVLVWWSCNKKNSPEPENSIPPKIVQFEFQKDSTKLGIDQAILMVSAACPAQPSYLYLNMLEGTGQIASTDPKITYDSTKSNSSLFVFKCENDTLNSQFLVSSDKAGIIKISGYMISDEEQSETHEAILIIYSNLSPKADFVYSILDSVYPVRIEFNGQASYDPDGQIREWNWIIDGQKHQSDSSICIESFSSAREIAVKLKVVDNEGASDSVQKKIQLINKKPVPVIRYSIDYNDYPPLLNLDGSDSYDPDGVIEQYTWIIGADTLENSSKEMQVELQYSGNFSITLIVTDNLGDSEIAQTEVQVTNLKPVAHFTVSELNQHYPRVFVANASQSADPDGQIVKYHWYMNNQYYRTVELDTIHLAIPNYVESLITLIVEDNFGLKDTVSHTIKPTNSLPLTEIDPDWNTVKIFYGEEHEILLTDNYVQDIDGNIVNYKWMDNGETIKEYQEPAGEFNYILTPGTHEIILEVSDEEGSSSDTVYAEVIHEEVRVSIQVESGQISGPFPLNLDVTASLLYPTDVSNFTSIEWEFGDGFAFSGPNPPAHTYLKEGEFDIVLRAEAEWGDVGTDTLTIQAVNIAPIALINPEWQNGEVQFTGPQCQLELTDQYCSDENGNIAKYEWFLDGQNVATYGPEPRGTFPLSVVGYGDHQLRLVVTDSTWAQASDEVIIRIINQPPTVELNITPGLSGTHPFEITANPIVSDPNGMDDIDSLIWDFADGTPVIIQRDIQSVNHIYTEPGMYELSVRVVDQGGNVAHSSQTISVSNTAPQAFFTVSPGTEGTVPFTVEFDASNSSDPNNDRLQYEWDFGDGETFMSEATNVTHTFDEPGGDGNREYVVTLTVRDPYDKKKAEDQYSRTIRITNTAPSPEINVLNNNGSSSGASPLSLQLSVNHNDPDQGQQHSFRWELLNENRVFIRSLGNTETISETFTTGIYYVRCYVSDGYAERYVDRRIESINYPPEVVFTSQPNRGNYPLRVAFTPQVSDPNGLDDISSCFWSFGDGNSMLAAPNERVFHVFERPGIFSVVLQVEDRAGNIESYRSEIIVSNEPPVAVLELINDGNDQYENGALAGSRLEFSAARSSDAESELSDLKFTYSWNSMIFVNEVQGQTSASYVSQNVGRFRVRLMVEDELGGRDIDELEVNCYNRAPEIQNISRTPSGNDIGTRETLLYQIQASDPDSNTPLDRLIITFEYSYSYLDLSGGGFGEVRTRTIDEIVYDGPYAGQVRINLLQPTEQVVSPIEVQATLRVYDTVEGVDGSENFNSKYDEIEDNFSYTVN